MERCEATMPLAVAMQLYFDYDQAVVEVKAPFASNGEPGFAVRRQRHEGLLKLSFPVKFNLVRGFEGVSDWGG